MEKKTDLIRKAVKALNPEKEAKIAELAKKQTLPTKEEVKAKIEKDIKSFKKLTSPKKEKESKKEKVAKVTKEVTPVNKVSLIEQVISEREVKYIYPSDCIDTLSRKSYRQKVRNTLRRLERDMLRIEDKTSKEYKKAEKVYKEYQKEVIKVKEAV